MDLSPWSSRLPVSWPVPQRRPLTYMSQQFGKIDPHGPLPLAQSAARSMGSTARATSYIHVTMLSILRMVSLPIVVTLSVASAAALTLFPRNCGGNAQYLMDWSLLANTSLRSSYLMSGVESRRRNLYRGKKIQGQLMLCWLVHDWSAGLTRTK